MPTNGEIIESIPKIGYFSFVFEKLMLICFVNKTILLKIKESVKALQPQLMYESRLYNAFSSSGNFIFVNIIFSHFFKKKQQTTVGIPKLLWFGREGPYNVMVIQLCGKSLEEIGAA